MGNLLGKLNLANIGGAPGTTAAGLATGAGIYYGLSTMIPGQAGQWIGGVAAAIVVIVSALAPALGSKN